MCDWFKFCNCFKERLELWLVIICSIYYCELVEFVYQHEIIFEKLGIVCLCLLYLLGISVISLFPYRCRIIDLSVRGLVSCRVNFFWWRSLERHFSRYWTIKRRLNCGAREDQKSKWNQKLYWSEEAGSIGLVERGWERRHCRARSLVDQSAKSGGVEIWRFAVKVQVVRNCEQRWRIE